MQSGHLIRSGDQAIRILDIPSDMGTPQMLVAWELMQMFAVEIDFKRNEITFFEGTHFHYPGKGEAVSLFLHTNGNGIARTSGNLITLNTDADTI